MAISKITTSGVSADTLTAADLAPNSVDSSELVDGSIDTAHIGDDQVTADKLANSINTDIATGVAALPKAGGTMTGAINTNNDIILSGSGSSQNITRHPTGAGWEPLVVRFKNASGANANGIKFQTGNASGTYTDRLVINSDTNTPHLLLNPNGGNVGIGTTAPASLQTSTDPVLQLEGVFPEIVFKDTNGTANSMSMSYKDNSIIWHRTTHGADTTNGNNTMAMQLSHTNNLHINYPENSGETGVRLGAAWSLPGLYNGGSVHVLTSGTYVNLGGGGNVWASFASGSYSLPSDKRLKANVASVENATESINKLRGVTYNLAARAESKLTVDPETHEDTYEDIIRPEGTELKSGLIADEVEEISEFAHLITHEETINRGEETPYKGLNYNGLIPYLIKSIQELSAKVTALENA